MGRRRRRSQRGTKGAPINTGIPNSNGNMRTMRGRTGGIGRQNQNGVVTAFGCDSHSDCMGGRCVNGRCSYVGTGSWNETGYGSCQGAFGGWAPWCQ